MRNVGRFLLAGAVLLTPALAQASGFALFEHGARGVGLGGAFAATADDPSAGYYNPAGLAFLNGTQVDAGVYFITEDSKFKGDNPYPGSTYSTKMESQVFYPPHLHITGRLTDQIRWGVSMYAPFGLGTWWPNDYAGKYITKRIDLKTFNINPNLAFKATEDVSFAVGLDYYISKVDLTKSIPYVNPYTQRVAEIGQVHMYNDNWANGLGWNVAFLAKMGSFSLGGSYRSHVKVKYDKANASFIQFQTGYTDFDTIIAGSLPFSSNPAAKTEVDYPAEARLGIGWREGAWLVDVDAVWMQWSTFKDLPITIVDHPELSSVRIEDYKDKTQYRIGVEYRTSQTFSVLVGYLYDPTPVPTASVSPLLPDANRNGYSVGFCWDMTPKLRFDAAYLYLPFKTRSSDGQDRDNYNGTYRTTANLLGFSLVYKF